MSKEEDKDQGSDDMAKELEELADQGEFLEFDKKGNPKKASLSDRVLKRFRGV